MELHVEPPLPRALQARLARALADADVMADDTPEAYRSPWWRAAAEAAVAAPDTVGREPEPALSTGRL